MLQFALYLNLYGYYEYDGRDKDGYHIGKQRKNCPTNTLEQEQLIKQSIIEYN